MEGNMREDHYRRRDILLGGLTFGAALAGGLLLTGSSQWTSRADAAGNRADHLQLSLSWNGLDFTWLPDNTRLAITSTDGLGILETGNGQLHWQKWPHIGSLSSQNRSSSTGTVSWSFDGTKVLYATATALLVQDVLTGQALWSHHVDQSAASIATLSPNGLYLALSQSPSITSHTVASMQFWNVQTGKLVTQIGGRSTPPPAVKSILWSPDSTHIATTSLEGTVQVWQASDADQLWSSADGLTAGPRQAISWSPDGSTIAFVSNGTDGQAELGLWDAHSGQLRFQTPALVGFLTDQLQQDNQVAWSPDGTRISFNVQSGTGSLIEVWSVQRGQRLFTCQPVNGQPTAPTWSPDGKYLAAGQTVVGSGELVSGDNGERSVVQFWDARNSHALFAYSAPKSPQHLAWSPDSRSLAIITPKTYGVLASATCLSMCRYGYSDYALEVFRVE
jgi:WD40 repeat protein